MHDKKGPKIRAGAPPPFSGNARKKIFFFQEVVPKWNDYTATAIWNESQFRDFRNGISSLLTHDQATHCVCETNPPIFKLESTGS